MVPIGQRIVLYLLQSLLVLLNLGLYLEIIRQLCHSTIGLSILIVISILALRFWNELKLSNLCDSIRKGCIGTIDDQLHFINILWLLAIIGFATLIPIFRLWDLLSFVKIGLAMLSLVFIGFIINKIDQRHCELPNRSTLFGQIFTWFGQWTVPRIVSFSIILIQGSFNFCLYGLIIRELCRSTSGIAIVIIILILALGIWLLYEINLPNLCVMAIGSKSINDQFASIDILLLITIIGLTSLIPVFGLWDILSMTKIGLAILTVLFLGLIIDYFDYICHGANGLSQLGKLKSAGYNLLAFTMTKVIRIFQYPAQLSRALVLKILFTFEYPIYALKYCWSLFTIAIRFCFFCRTVAPLDRNPNLVNIEIDQDGEFDPDETDQEDETDQDDEVDQVEIDLRLLCVVCKVSEKIIMVENCNHLCMCDQCAQIILNLNHPKCPMCRNAIISVRNVFF